MNARLDALHLALIAALIVAGGCTRTFGSPQGNRDPGQICAQGGDCVSGVCDESVCCDRACGPDESCTLPGTVGTCTPRGLGVSCTADAMCGSKFCRDKVCCDKDCGEKCFTCAGRDAGSCHPADDDTDPHGDCTETCTACFAGNCGTAFANTDPHSECDAGEACNGGGACGSKNGNICASDYDCISEGCITWQCQDVAYAHVDDYPFLRTDRHRTPLAVAVGPGGDTAVLVDTDDGPTADGGYQGSVVAALATSPTGPWIASHIEYNADGRRLGAVAFAGDVAYFAVASDIAPGSADADIYGYSGIYVSAITSAGVPGGTDYPDPDSVDLIQIALGNDDRGVLTLAAVSDGGTLRVEVRGRDGTWADAGVSDAQASGVAIAQANGDSQFFLVAGGQLTLVYPDGRTEVAAQPPGGCSGPVYAATAPAEVGQQIGLVVTCGGLTYLGAFAPLSTDPDRWRFVPAPLDAPYAGLEDDGTRYPIRLFRPAGGHDGNIAFSAIEPGDSSGAPVGGYAQILWLQQDGGLFYSYASPSDNAYNYEALAAAPTPTGASVTAFDTVIDPDGGVNINNSTLLIQSFFP